MAKRATPKQAAKKRRDANTLDPSELRDYLDRVHKLTDEMESQSASKRAQIGNVYELAAQKLDVSKGSLKRIYGKERRERKDEAWAAKADSRDRDSLLRLSAAMGLDSPLGAWAQHVAEQIPQETPAD